MYDSSQLCSIVEINCAVWMFVFFASLVWGVNARHHVNYNETWFVEDKRLGCMQFCEVVLFEPKLPAV